MDGLRRVDHWLIERTRQHSLTWLRGALAVVFLWFGVLKVIGRSPVEDLVARSVPWIPSDILVPGLGMIEVIIGVGLITLVAVRVVFLLFFLQMAGTFLLLAVGPSVTFQEGNPLLLSTLGEFIIKNLVLMAAGIAVAAHSVPKARRAAFSDILLERGLPRRR